MLYKLNIILILLSLISFSQKPFNSKSGVVKNSTIFRKVDEVAQFPGGEMNMARFLTKNLIYPEKSKTGNLQGSIFLSFIVNKLGQIKKISFLKKTNNDELNNAVIKVIKMMPKWTPAKINGSYVDSYYNLPVRIEFE
jgi:periplasmic protein TonB